MSKNMMLLKNNYIDIDVFFQPLTAVGKAKAAYKGINNLRIKKDGFIPLC